MRRRRRAQIGAYRNAAIAGRFEVSSLTNWGRTGFDGDMSGPWLHAELIAS